MIALQANVKKSLVSINIDDVRYLMSGFEYFLNGFASMLIPTKPMVVPDRSRRALSIALVMPFCPKLILSHTLCPCTICPIGQVICDDFT